VCQLQVSYLRFGNACGESTSACEWVLRTTYTAGIIAFLLLQATQGKRPGKQASQTGMVSRQTARGRQTVAAKHLQTQCTLVL
jgi:hypothetical protein